MMVQGHIIFIGAWSIDFIKLEFWLPNFRDFKRTFCGQSSGLPTP
jgi:hypothetical protein